MIGSTRRTFLRTLATACASITALDPHLGRAQTSSTEIWTGDCSVEPGVQFLLDWQNGLPVVSITDLVAPGDWIDYRHPSLPLALKVPPDWTPIAGWATSFTDTGMPIWSDQQPTLPQLTVFRLLSPKQDAAFEYAVGSLIGPPLSPEQAAPIAVQSLLGEGTEVDEVCSAIDTNSLGPSWFATYRFQKSLFASRLFVYAAPNAFNPATIVTYTSLVGPRHDFNDLAHDVFARMIAQFMGAASGDGGGGIGGGDDDDDGDDADDEG